MKKFLTLLITLAIAVSASAQLNVRQVLEKAEKSISVKDGIKGKVTIKHLGIGGTTDFATDGTQMHIADGEELDWISEEIVYSVDTKAKTLTIEDGSKDYALMLMPFGMAHILLDEKLSKEAKVSGLKMKTEKTQYVITFDMDGASTELAVDRQTFHPICFKAKKAFITIISVSYSNLTKLTDKSILTFDKSKYPAYKVIDERGKGENKKKDK